jgi:aminocarboxymuconate-semialdehyde decarboxylase
MDRTGVDIQVLTVSSVGHPTYWADAEAGLKLEQQINARIAEMIAAHPDRFLGIGGVPLQAPALAAKELERQMKELGFVGTQISSQAGAMELGDKRLWPFWEKAEELGAIIYLHPAGTTDPRYEAWQMWNSIGQPVEEALSMASLMYEGVLDAFPKLKICIAHGGGYLPYYIGRLDRNYIEKPMTRVNMTRSPSEYLKMFYYDTCVYNVDILEYLVEKVGVSQVILGSDYPVGEEEPVEFVLNSTKLSASDKERIISGNAMDLFGRAALLPGRNAGAA